MALSAGAPRPGASHCRCGSRCADMGESTHMVEHWAMSKPLRPPWDCDPPRRWFIAIFAGVFGLLVAACGASTPTATPGPPATTSSRATAVSVPPTTALQAPRLYPGTKVVPVGYHVLSLSCPTASFCMGVGIEDRITGTSGFSVAYHGGAWAAPVIVEPPSSSVSKQINAVSCPSSSFCMAVDANGSALEYAGGHWSAPVVVDPGGDLSAVSCLAASACTAVDSTNAVFTYDGAQWSAHSAQSNGSQGLVALSCSLPSSCIALADFGSAFVETDGAWSSPIAIAPNDDHASGPALDSVSCVALSAFCVAADSGGHAWAWTNGTWLPASTIDPPLAGCVGSGSSGSSSFSTSSCSPGSGMWVSCPTVSYCMAADSLGHEITWNGKGWSLPAKVDQAGFSALSCASASFCEAIDSRGDAVSLRSARA